MDEWCLSIVLGIKVPGRQSLAREWGKREIFHRGITSIPFWRCQTGGWSGENEHENWFRGLQALGEYTVKDLRHHPAGDGKSLSFVFFQSEMPFHPLTNSHMAGTLCSCRSVLWRKKNRDRERCSLTEAAWGSFADIWQMAEATEISKSCAYLLLNERVFQVGRIEKEGK